MVRDFVWIAEPLPEGDFFELLKPIDDETEVRAKAQAAISAQTGFDRVETIEYDADGPDPELRRAPGPPARARPRRGPSSSPSSRRCLRERFAPGDYPVPMRADLLRVTSR